MERQRAAARASAKFKMAQGLDYTGADTVFTGYETLTEKDAEVVALVATNKERSTPTASRLTGLKPAANA